MCFCAWSQKRNTKKEVVFAYLILAFISVIRFDIGFDYESYWHFFYNATLGYSKGMNVGDLLLYYVKEPFTLLLVMISYLLPGAPVWIFAIYACLTIYFIYKTVEYWNPKKHAICIFVFFISGVFFETWDWVRQGLALSILLYSLKYVDQQRKGRFFLCVIYAFCCHFSAMIFVIIYYIKDVKLNPRVLMVIIGVLYGMGVIGFWGKLYGHIFSMLPLYAEVYSDSKFTDDSNSNYQTVGFLWSAVWYGFLTFQVYKRNVLFGNLLFIGNVLTMVSGNNLLIHRIAWFFTSVQILAVPLVLKKVLVGKLSHIIMLLMVLVMYVRFNKCLAEKNGIRGSSPYETIFSLDYENKNFRLREYEIPDMF